MRVVKRVNERSLNTRVRTLLKRCPPLPKRNFDYTPTEPLNGADLRLGRSRGRDYSARNAEPARTPRHTLGHVARRRGHNSALKFSRRQASDCTRCAPNLERADRLKILEFQVDLGGSVRNIQTNERRASRGVRDHAPRL